MRSDRCSGPAASLLLALATAPLAAQEAGPPSPRIEFRTVLRQAADGLEIEVRRRGDFYRHDLPGGSTGGMILYHLPSNISTMIDGGDVIQMRLPPSEIGGLDAAAIMQGLATDCEVTWETGARRQIAGAECTDYLGTGKRNGATVTAQFCVTGQGIPLAITIGGLGPPERALEATVLEVGPQPAELFTLPPGVSARLPQPSDQIPSRC